jgi:hypothetical protein
MHFPFSKNLSNKKNEQKIKKMSNLGPYSNFGSPNHELSFKLFFGLDRLVFLQNDAM